MSKDNPVYVVTNGGAVVVTGAQPKDALLYATSKTDLNRIHRENRIKMRQNTKEILKRIKESTARA